MSSEPHDRSAAGPAFRAVFDAELPYVVRSLRRLGVPERDVEDVAQEVFLVVHRRFAEYDPERPVRPWLFAFAARVAANHSRLARHRRERLDGGGHAHREDGGDGPEARAAASEARAQLLQALEQVPFDRRTVVVMHELDGCTAPVIAEALGLPVNTVYSRLRLGRQELTRAVRELRGEQP